MKWHQQVSSSYRESLRNFRNFFRHLRPKIWFCLNLCEFWFLHWICLIFKIQMLLFFLVQKENFLYLKGSLSLWPVYDQTSFQLRTDGDRDSWRCAETSLLISKAILKRKWLHFPLCLKKALHKWCFILFRLSILM